MTYLKEANPYLFETIKLMEEYHKTDSNKTKFGVVLLLPGYIHNLYKTPRHKIKFLKTPLSVGSEYEGRVCVACHPPIPNAINHKGKLTDQERQEIYFACLNDETQANVAKRFGVSRMTVSRIMREV